jgi:oxygen-independent coproporphyrinogen-3 oxidase
VKGYRLNEEDQIVREVIETLMCNYSLNWSELSARLSIPVEKIKRATAYNSILFSTFAADGILTFDEQQMQVTPQGTLFVRNIAAALDKRMLHSDKSFSKPV